MVVPVEVLADGQGGAVAVGGVAHRDVAGYGDFYALAAVAI